MFMFMVEVRCVYVCRAVKREGWLSARAPDQTNLFYLHVYSYLTNKYR